MRRQEEEGDGEVPLNTEPTNWAELDPKSMKVAELKQELELRTLSPKGGSPDGRGQDRTKVAQSRNCCVI